MLTKGNMIKLYVFVILLYISSCGCQMSYELRINGEAEYGYYVSVYVGSPPQPVNLLLDTGSSNIAIAAVPPNPESKKYFHTNESTTFNPLDIAVDLRYVVGQWSGFLAKDVLSFNKEELNCTIACMQTITNIFEKNSKFQGLLGLGYCPIAIPDSSVEPFLDTLLEAKNVTNTFSLDLCGPYFSSQNHETNCGRFHIGKVFNFYKENLAYTPIIKEWYYEIILTNFKVGAMKVPVHCQDLNNDRSIIDSGTTELLMPKSVYKWTLEEIHKHVPYFSSNIEIANRTICLGHERNVTDFPTLTISFYHSANSTFDLLITPELYLLRSFKNVKNFTCFKLAISMSNNGFVIGSTIMKGFYIHFDKENKRIGFGNSSHVNITSVNPGFVMKPKYTNQNIHCKWRKDTEDSKISPLMIVILVVAVLGALVLLYMLSSWIFETFILRSDDASETSSLVDGIVLETWND